VWTREFDFLHSCPVLAFTLSYVGIPRFVLTRVAPPPSYSTTPSRQDAKTFNDSSKVLRLTRSDVDATKDDRRSPLAGIARASKYGPLFALSMRGRAKLVGTKASPMPQTSALGRLHVLPLEILPITLTSLDFRSLQRFSRISKKSRGVVQSLRGLFVFKYHVSEILQRLRQMGIIERHSVNILFRAFRSSDCTECSAWGPVLHLPTCQRYCRNYLQGLPEYCILPTDIFKSFPHIALSQREGTVRHARVYTRAGLRYNEAYSAMYVNQNQAAIAEQLHRSGRVWFQMMRTGYSCRSIYSGNLDLWVRHT
jgi:hypothetical protein